MCESVGVFRREDWYVADAPIKDAKKMVEVYHYAKGGSRTAVYVHGLYERATGRLCGVAWWLPPTRVACESVNKAEWKKVLSLSRMVILPDVPKNACSFLLSKSVKMIRSDGRFVSLVTYADESQGHLGTIYKASNWAYVGRTGPYTKWLDKNGRQVSAKSTVNRTNAEMEALGFMKVGRFYKHKYVLHLKSVPIRSTIVKEV